MRNPITYEIARPALSKRGPWHARVAQKRERFDAAFESARAVAIRSARFGHAEAQRERDAHEMEELRRQEEAESHAHEMEELRRQEEAEAQRRHFM